MDILRWEKERGDGRLRRILWYLSLRVLDLLVKITLARAVSVSIDLAVSFIAACVTTGLDPATPSPDVKPKSHEKEQQVNPATPHSLQR